MNERERIDADQEALYGYPGEMNVLFETYKTFIGDNLYVEMLKIAKIKVQVQFSDNFVQIKAVKQNKTRTRAVGRIISLKDLQDTSDQRWLILDKWRDIIIEMLKKV